MNAPIKKGAPGCMFAAIGLAICGIVLAVYSAQHALLVYGPAWRNWALAHALHIAIAAYGALVLIAIWGLSRLDP